MATPFFAVRPPCRNDADSFSSLVLIHFNAVGYQQHQHSTHRSNGLPAELSAFNPILFYKSEGIVENVLGDFETNPMFPNIGPCFVPVPFEVNSCHHSIVVTCL